LNFGTRRNETGIFFNPPSKDFSNSCLETSHKVCLRVNDHNLTATIPMFLKHKSGNVATLLELTVSRGS